MKRLGLLSLAAVCMCSCVKEAAKVNTPVQEKLSVQMARSEMKRVSNTLNLDFRTTPKWNYSAGLELYSFLQTAEKYGDKEMFKYVYSYVDTMVQIDGSIYNYKPEEYNIDHVNAGKLLFSIYDITQEARFEKASNLLRSQMLTHPRTTEGGWWHKKVYPHQLWLDGLYMGAPFVAEYGKRNGEDVYEDVVKQFLIVGKHTYDDSTHLYRHAWDEAKEQFWADPTTGCSQHAWGRANGWFMMAMVDVLAIVPEGTVGRDSLLNMFRGLSETLLDYRDENGDFTEASHLGGRADIIELVRIFEKQNPELPMRVDHGMTMLGDGDKGYNAGYSFLGRMFAMGQVQGIIATVDRELGLKYKITGFYE